MTKLQAVQLIASRLEPKCRRGFLSRSVVQKAALRHSLEPDYSGLHSIAQKD
jgi:hypothetical protein